MGVDAEKPFDRLEWSYLYEVLPAYNFPNEIIKMIKTVYKTPVAYVYSNGILSEGIQITRGNEARMPVIPITFCLSCRATGSDNSTIRQEWRY